MASRFVGTPYKQFHETGPFDAIVVGSGIGGLGTAALLAKAAGRRVLVLEKHYTAGGFTHVFHRPGFEWDVGVHYIGQVHRAGSQAEALFEYLAEGRLSWSAMSDVYDRVSIDGLRFDYVSGREALRDELVRTFPLERYAIDRYFRAIRQCMRRLPLYFVEKALPPLLPAASETVTTWELSTPLSTQHFANAPHGEMYGLAHTPGRFESRDLRSRAPIRGLFLTGQDIGMCGVMGALSGAVVTASAMLRRNMFGEVSKAARRRARLNSG